MKRLFGLILVATIATLADDSAGATVPYRWRPEDPFTNAIGMTFVWIPAGSFMMGSPKEEQGRRENETHHMVVLTKGFYMGIHLVTQEQWMEVMGNNPSDVKGEENLPVERVSWTECQEFIKKLRKKDKKPYCLPTEAEWEYACRAGTTTRFFCGETISTGQANFDDGICLWKTTPVACYPANVWGLHDMGGNVYQWCQDWYGEYSKERVVDPRGPEKGESRVLRGGSWRGIDLSCRSAYRNWAEPERRSAVLGFRICFRAE